VPELVSCFAGTHEGRPVMGRFYCQQHSRQVLVFDDGAVIEIPDDAPPVAGRRIDVLQRLGSVICRKLR
jgi:hypothetical protein